MGIRERNEEGMKNKWTEEEMTKQKKAEPRFVWWDVQMSHQRIYKELICISHGPTGAGVTVTSDGRRSIRVEGCSVKKSKTVHWPITPPTVRHDGTARLLFFTVITVIKQLLSPLLEGFSIPRGKKQHIPLLHWQL